MIVINKVVIIYANGGSILRFYGHAIVGTVNTQLVLDLLLHLPIIINGPLAVYDFNNKIELKNESNSIMEHVT